MTPTQRAAALRLIEFETLPRRLLDIACRVRVNECLFHDDEFVDDASHALKEAIDLLRELAAEPVQGEPVAWRTVNANPPGGYVIFQQYPQALADLGREIEPLYTAPQQRKPLTDDFVFKVVRSVQPNLAETCRAWKYEFAQCKYWLDAAHGIGEPT